MQELPKRYTVAQFDAPRVPLTVKSVALRLPSSGEVLLKVLACGVCHTDELIGSGAFRNKFPCIPGHEIIGDIVRVPDDEKTWKVGDRVGAAWFGGSDGTCQACKKGLNQMCANGEINGCSRDGGYAEIEPGETVAVQGLGGLGHLAVQYARKMGYRVIVISSSSAKRELAMKLGAHDYVDGSEGDVADQLQKLGGAACIMLTAPNPELIPLLLKGLDPLGKLLIVAATGPGCLDTTMMISKGLSIVAWPSGNAKDCKAAVEFAQKHDVSCMVEKFPLSRANQALEHMSSGKVRFRSVLVPDES
ncbi:alcohol dehydrogenase [Lasiodiplodia theobromae]|uniref:alcohol dehydrogenase n=1 Tax=Lasiodiplodia theobromae TaxID=45133 RepID=UPI0015C35C13|nr:alcohol dehydrogenase [Lasiodiplodia theobromae]KAF4546332.1 alcohol dehydrogenase [Lasiodiplodia theobromae]